jgi:integrase/recombinase XerD
MLVCVKGFFRWTTRQHLTLFNPASEIELARKPHRLPRDILTAAEAEAVMSQPDVREPLGIRDRAILETFYATGVRRIELVNLALYDLDANRGTVMVREGKGLKDRVVPIGQRALDWIDKYLVEVRPDLAVEPDEKYLFLTTSGGPFHGRWVMGELVRRYIRASGVEKNGGCHMFRHTVATLMLENGADIRFIQELLGHVKLTSTQIYTHVSIAKLQQIYRATHPLEQARARAASGEPATSLTPEAQELLETLDEDDDEGSEVSTSPGQREAG